MRCAIGADDVAPLTDALLAELKRRGIAAERFGSLRVRRAGDAPPADDGEWASIGRAVGEAVAAGRAEVGIVCCFTGTGISIAANKVRGVRAALCGDAATAVGARRWNDANVLALSLRSTSTTVGLEILAAFLATAASRDPGDRRSIEAVEALNPS
jgi:ribose 5-phosphate isomerase B